jgi:hypothetical protein
MAHHAFIDENNIVIDVQVITRDVIDTGEFGDPTRWIKTSYNTRGGVHYEPNSWTPSPDQSKALRKNYAGVGYTYDPILDAFYEPKPYPSWILDPDTCYWEPPVPRPPVREGYTQEWDEAAQEWVEVPMNPA